MFKTYLLTTKLNLMKKLNSKGKSFVMAISFCVAFMFLGASTVSAQWVSPDEAVLILKTEIGALDVDFQQAQSNDEKLEIAFRHKYYSAVMEDIALGTEVAQAVTNNRPENKPTLHSSGMVAFSGDDPNFKQEANGLVADATDLLSD